MTIYHIREKNSQFLLQSYHNIYEINEQTHWLFNGGINDYYY